MLAFTGQLARSLDMAVRDLRQNPNVPNTRMHIGLPLLLLADDDRTDWWLEAAEVEGMEFQRLDQLRILQDIYGGRRTEALDPCRRGSCAVSRELRIRRRSRGGEIVSWGNGVRAPELERRTRLAPTASTGVFWDVTHRTLLGLAVQRLGDSQRADELFDQSLRHSYSVYEGGSESAAIPLEIAQIHATRGDAPQALDWLERAYQLGLRSYRVLHLDPMLESLRTEQQFQEIVSRMEADVAQERVLAEGGRGVFVVDSVIAAAGVRQQEQQ